MTDEQAAKLWNEIDSLPRTERQFSQITEVDRLNQSQKICGILKLQSLMLKPEAILPESDYEWIALCKPSDLRESVSREDAIYLIRCGVFFSYRDGYFFIFD